MVYNKKIKSVVKDIRKTCVDNGIKLKLVDKKIVICGDITTCNGYFWDDRNELVVATKKPLKEWFYVLLHESSHMDQWIEKSDIWESVDDHFDMDKWINGMIKYKDSFAKKCIDNIIKMELDCEKRTVEKIVKYNLLDVIDVGEYIQKANTYILSYVYAKKYKVDFIKTPYETEEVWKNMETGFNINYKTLTNKQIELFDKCIKK